MSPSTSSSQPSSSAHTYDIMSSKCGSAQPGCLAAPPPREKRDVACASLGHRSCRVRVQKKPSHHFSSGRANCEVELRESVSGTCSLPSTTANVIRSPLDDNDEMMCKILCSRFPPKISYVHEWRLCKTVGGDSPQERLPQSC